MTVFVEVVSKLKILEVRQWVSYGRGCQTDTRVVFATRANVTVPAKDIEQLKTLGVGLLQIGSSGVFEVIAPKDLALQIQLPEVPRSLKRILGEAYDQFDRGEWREGFETAAQVLEQEARSYLKTHVSSGRIVVREKNGKSLKPSSLDRLTMGGLAEKFSLITGPNSADTRIGQALSQINADRITVAHFKNKGVAREKRLRANVSHHMWVVVGALRAIKGLKP